MILTETAFHQDLDLCSEPGYDKMHYKDLDSETLIDRHHEQISRNNNVGYFQD